MHMLGSCAHSCQVHHIDPRDHLDSLSCILMDSEESILLISLLLYFVVFTVLIFRLQIYSL